MMRTDSTSTRRLFACLALLALGACTARQPCASTPATATAQSHFATPRALVEALINACRNNDPAALVAAVGPANAGLVQSGDPAGDRAQCQRFVASADQMTRLDPAGADRVVLVTGTDEYPLPVPLVKDAQGWHLDTTAGAAEILRRTVGSNELRTIATCRATAQGAPLPASASGYAYRSLGGPAAIAVASPLAYRRSGVMTFIVAKNGTVYEKDLGAETAQLAAAINGAAPDASWTPVES